MQASDLTPAFHNPVMDAQAVYRVLLDAMAHPGKICELGIAVPALAPLSPALCAALLSLTDVDTSVWWAPSLQTASTLDYFKFHCGCPSTNYPGNAAFAVLCGAQARLKGFSIGDDAYPDRSTTLFIQLDELQDDGHLQLSGPGIETQTTLGLPGVNPEFWNDWAHNHAAYPLGVDIFFCCENQLVGLPRSTQVEQS